MFFPLLFGELVNPPSWCGISKMLCDLSNGMTMMEDWDQYILFSLIQPIIPAPQHLDKSIPFAKGRRIAVEVPITLLGQVDAFIDNIIKVFLARPNIIKKNAASAPLALHVSIQPLAADKPVQRKENLTIPRLLAEETHSKITMYLDG